MGIRLLAAAAAATGITVAALVPGGLDLASLGHHRLPECATCHSTPGSGTAAVTAARRYMGRPYVWGGTGPQVFDCSGLTQRAYADIGITIPRNSGQQSRAGKPVHGLANARPGDLLFWAYPDGTVHHVAMYVGDGRVIEAPQPGERVSQRPVYDRSHLVAIRRITKGGP